MRLTRRDAVIALGAVGLGSYSTGQLVNSREDGDEVATILAVTELLYPSQVEVDEEFVETYVLGRANAETEYESYITEAVSELNRQSEHDFGQSFEALSADRRRRVLRSIGVNRVRSNPDGTLAQRIRHYLIKDLLYALYSTPVGGQLLDTENPPGHPGGRDAYQRGPEGRE
jgi:hypothetical protein